MNKAAKELRAFIKAAIQNNCDYPTASRLVTAALKEEREAQKEKDANFNAGSVCRDCAEEIRAAIRRKG